MLKTELVRDWMTYDPVTISPENTLPDAHHLMKKHHIRRLPVVDDHHELVGIVTLGDVRGAEPSGATSLSIWEVNYLISRLRVQEIMTPNPVTASEDAEVGEAAYLMLKYKVSGLPVLDATGRLTGIITESDIFRMVVQEWLNEVQPA